MSQVLKMQQNDSDLQLPLFDGANYTNASLVCEQSHMFTCSGKPLKVCTLAKLQFSPFVSYLVLSHHSCRLMGFEPLTFDRRKRRKLCILFPLFQSINWKLQRDTLRLTH